MLLSELTSVSWYKDRMRRYGEDDVRCLGWGSNESQLRRFEAVLSQVGEHETVLDVGCGRGDMARYVDQYHYEGVDTCNSMIIAARKRYPFHHFRVGTVGDFEPASRDWVVASGLFALQHEEWDYRTLTIVQRMYDVCERGVCVNFIVRTKDDNADMHYTTQDAVDRLLRRLCRNRVYLDGYLPNDFTVVLHRGRRARKP